MTSIHIAGAGLAGMTLAIALDQSLSGKGTTPSIHLFERLSQTQASNVEKDTRTTAIAYATKVMFENLGVWNSLESHAATIDKMLVCNGEGSNINFNPAAFTENPMGYILPNAILKQVLIDQMSKQNNINVHYESRVAKFSNTPAGLSLQIQNNKNTDTHSSNLLIGCDGANSDLRKQAGFNTFVRDYKQTALVCNLQLEQPHQNQAFQLFKKSGPIALLPLPGTADQPNRVSLIWSHEDEAASDLKNLDTPAFLTLINSHIEKFYGKAINASPRQNFPLRAFHLETFVQQNFALLGEAAHVVHPLAGQGFNLTARDISVLCATLKKAQACGDDLGSKVVLEKYQHNRAADISKMFGFTDQISFMLSGSSRLPKPLRDIGFAVVEGSTHLNETLTKHAMGLVDDLPPMMVENWPKRFANLC